MNIREIAKMAGVSTATVSRSLHNKANVSKSTKERVLQVVREYRYQLTPPGKRYAVDSNSIGLILPDITNPFFPDIARGVEDAAHASGFSVVLCNSDNQQEIEENYIRLLTDQGACGLIVISSGNFLANAKHDVTVPVVLCDRLTSSSPFSSVATNHFLAAKLAVQHLYELGHRTIGMIAGSREDERVKGFIQTCKDLKLPLTEDSIIYGDFGYEYESGLHSMNQMLEKYLPTGLFCANDMIALGAIAAVEDKGLHVPNDVSVVGYDNILFSGLCKPALTTVEQPTYLLGVTAFEVLVDQLKTDVEEKLQPEHRVLTPKLIIRNSTGRVSG